MARKSRKEAAAVVVQEADAACRAAIYVRLSVEDTHTHSVSIETQQMIIARYLEQYPEISVYDTYIDNGATGTNFHRPGFQQMLSDTSVVWRIKRNGWRKKAAVPSWTTSCPTDEQSLGTRSLWITFTMRKYAALRTPGSELKKYDLRVL